MGEEVIDHSGLDYYDPTMTTPVPAPAPKPYKQNKQTDKAKKGFHVLKT